MADCARCFEPKPAVSTERFAFGAGTYELALCRQHLDLFQREMYSWAAVSSPVGAEPARTGNRGTVVIRSSDPDEEPAPPPQRSNLLELPPEWNTWSFSKHALERQQSRGVSRAEAMLTATQPDTVYPGLDHPDTEVRIRAHVKVVVNPNNRRILTVINRAVDDQSTGSGANGYPLKV